jgi:iron(II)-dependent oxidoreductase
VGNAPPLAIDAGVFTIGTDAVGWAYDNERPAHMVELAAFSIDAAPVTNATYGAFIAGGGYDDERLWHPDGWDWRRENDARAPLFWTEEGTVLRFGSTIALDPDEPVQHVSWYEADACARWLGCRLPTEAEWEAASPTNTGQVWEWTASSFAAWPGFASFPYREYSEVFYGPEYKVLRGGSWATHPDAMRPTFRNWDFPIRRQIFSGFRCASDV